ncbi:CoA-binding protein [Blastochloris sulfoviridis]|uniref:CoA-binding protein n=2 Tax=Blastochloris sulfoviridis TaxID=50712 RepID=A0A5M6HUP0_9HYPH|nr:CoA-binding protein [Blastochloris sulfoviridis]
MPAHGRASAGRDPDAALRRILTGTTTIALLGASANPARPSHQVLGYLIAAGYRVHPVNPGLAGQTLLGRTVHAGLADVPEPVEMVDVFRDSSHLPRILAEMLALDVRPKVLWTQLGVVDDTVAAQAEAAGIAVVMDRCPAIEIPRLGLAGRHR